MGTRETGEGWTCQVWEVRRSSKKDFLYLSRRTESKDLGGPEVPDRVRDQDKHSGGVENGGGSGRPDKGRGDGTV